MKPTSTHPALNGPPLPPAIFRVGITGHRPNHLPADTTALAAQLQRILAEIQSAARALNPSTQLRLISSLAEGTDRLAAHAALALGYTLQAPLPFPREEYARDFASPTSLADFHHLLARATAIFELEPSPPHRDFAYRAAGHIVLRHCDLLLAVWDGEPSRGVGGTSELIDAAQDINHPTLILDASAAHAFSFNDHPDPLAALRTLIHATLGPLDPTGQTASSNYLAERWPKRIATTSYSILRLLGEHRFARASAPQPTAPSDLESPLFHRYFRWVDALAVLYGERSRSAAVRMQLLALAAVLSAILILPFEEHRAALQILSLSEVAFILGLLFEAMRSRRNDWHTRWMLYRSLSENLRCLDLLAPLSDVLPNPTTAGPSNSSDLSDSGDSNSPTRDFASSFLQAVTRELGLATAAITPAFLASRVRALASVVDGQAAFQRKVAHRYETVEQALRRVGITLFSLAIVLCLFDLLRALSPALVDLLNAHGLSGVRMATAAAILPSLGAALAGLAAQGEFKRLATRAEAMSTTLQTLSHELQSQPHPTLRTLQVFASRTAQVLTSEVQDWQVLVAAKPPTLPT